MEKDKFSRWYLANREIIDWLLSPNPSIITEKHHLIHPTFSHAFSTYQPSFEHLPSITRQNLLDLKIQLADIEEDNAYIPIGAKEYLRRVTKACINTSVVIRLPDRTPRRITKTFYLGLGGRVLIGDFEVKIFDGLPKDIPIFEVLAVEKNFAIIGPPSD